MQKIRAKNFRFKYPSSSYNFIKCVKGANILAHEKVVLESKNPEYIRLFAINVHGANVIALDKALLELGELSSHKCLTFYFPNLSEIKSLDGTQQIKKELDDLFTQYINAKSSGGHKK